MSVLFVGRTALRTAAELEKRYVLGHVRVVPDMAAAVEAWRADGHHEVQMVFCHPAPDDALPELVGLVAGEAGGVRLAQLGGEPLPMLAHMVPVFHHIEELAGYMGWPRRVHTVRVAVLSLKGGSGKTLTLSNLAALLAQKGLRVLWVDGDLVNENVRLITGVEPTGGLAELVRRCTDGRGHVSVSPADLAECTAFWQTGGVWVLHAGQASAVDAVWRQVVAEEVLTAADGRFDAVLVDLPADIHFSSPFAAALFDLAEADPGRHLFGVVATYGVTEIDGADAVLALLRRRKLLDRVETWLVLNRVVEVSMLTNLERTIRALLSAYGLSEDRVVRLPELGVLAQEATIVWQPVVRMAFGRTWWQRLRPENRRRNALVAAYRRGLAPLAERVAAMARKEPAQEEAA